MSERSDETCPFCEIVAGRMPASTVIADESVVAAMDLRQFHPGHVIVIPRRHVADIRQLDIPTAEALMRAMVAISRALDAAFPSDGLSVWHSAGRGANQEVPHLHFHIHPRVEGDDVLRVYPSAPCYPDRATLDRWAGALKAAMNRDA
jgi:histidine triad (HIT) family protein